jgi:lipopolysaccharide transport system ATP-binding protein
MAQTIISVQNLSKSFQIKHYKSLESQTTLRDSIGNKLKSIFSNQAIQTTNDETFWALRNLSFDVQAGDKMAVIGGNGAGKSTMFKILSRIMKPTSGKVIIHGNVSSLLEVGTGFHPELTGKENIFLSGAILGMSNSEIRKRFDEIVEFSNVGQFLETPVKRFSSGMYVRLAFAVAAHLETDIMILDEVLAVGDMDFQNKCFAKIRDIADSGRTILFVSHSMESARNICNKAILLQNGELIASGLTEDVIQKYLGQ